MAKSLRSKTKRHFRNVKRQDGAFAVAHAARLQRLSAKLANVKGQDVEIHDGTEEEQLDVLQHQTSATGAESMDVEQRKPVEKNISTSGPRATRRGLRKVNELKQQASKRKQRGGRR